MALVLEHYHMESAVRFRAFLGLSGLLTAMQLAAADGDDKKAKSFIEHTIRDVEGWQVRVDNRLLDGPHKPVGDSALRLLSNKLYELKLVLPADKVEKLIDVPIWLDFEHPLTSMQYHPAAAWLRDHGYDPAMEKGVHIPRAQGLIDEIRKNRQPSVVLHELAHAFHDRELGFDYELIRQAYDQAVESKRYESILLIDGHDTRHYALTNHKEYFAEMTESFFGTNDFYPFVRAELKQYDPRTYETLSKVWGRKVWGRE